MVARKKPDPAIYTLAATTLGLTPARCVVVEDSHIGLSAAKAAGMRCVVTRSAYTAGEDFSAADRVVDDLETGQIALATCASLVG
jgi:beta-phosphoglucomutase-like phosphatase (HAD superfamily)